MTNGIAIAHSSVIEAWSLVIQRTVVMDHNPYSVGNEPSNGQAPTANVRTMQIIAFALMMGVVVFGVIVMFQTGGQLNGKPGLLTWIAAGFAGLMIVNHLAIPLIIAGATWKKLAADGIRQKSEQEQAQAAMGVYQAQMIVALALLEGAAFFNLVVVMQERTMISLGIVIALLVLMLIKFPTTTKVTWWIEDRLRE
jgi:hypothetical protein